VESSILNRSKVYSSPVTSGSGAPTWRMIERVVPS
jgi:hypothetical protein